MAPLRIVFMGTPEIAATVLTRLAAAPIGEIVGVISQPDRPKGRHLQMHPTPVKVAAQRLGLNIWQPEKARSPDTLQKLTELKPDVIVVVAYGQLLPAALLEIPRLGCLNIHTSLLPRWRGAAPIQWAIASGDEVTGVTLMRMDAGLDTGPIVAQRSTSIKDTDTGQSLHDRLAELGGDLLVDALPRYSRGELKPAAQPESGVTYARKISRTDGQLDWSLNAIVLWRRIRAFTPWPGAYSFLGEQPKGRLLKIHAVHLAEMSGAPGHVLAADGQGLVVACGVGALRITELQPESGRRMTATEFLAGHPLDPESVFR